MDRHKPVGLRLDGPGFRSQAHDNDAILLEYVFLPKLRDLVHSCSRVGHQPRAPALRVPQGLTFTRVRDLQGSLENGLRLVSGEGVASCLRLLQQANVRRNLHRKAGHLVA